MPHRLLTVAVVAGSLAAALAACGSSSGSASSAGPAPSASTAPSTTAGSGTPSTAPGVQAPVSGPVPAVAGATDLSKAPTIAAGTGTPPTVLTDADLVAGTGPAAAPDATVNVQYVGALYTTGQVFDASWAHGGPVSFSLDQVVPGFRDAIAGMKVGGRREVVIPPALGYGSQGNASIPPNSTLVFVIDLLSTSG